MNRTLKKLLLWSLIGVVSLSLSLLVSGWVFADTIGSKSVVKNWIATSGIYDSFVSEVVNSSESEVITDSNDGQTIDRKVLETAASSAFPPALLQDSTENVVDGSYNWLNGTNESLEFSINFMQAKTDYAKSIRSQAEARLASLPQCTQSQLQSLGSIDPFSIPCKPPASVTDSAVLDLEKSIITAEDFLPDPTLTADDITITRNGTDQTIDQVIPYAPALFQFLLLARYLALVLIVVSIGLVVYLHSNKVLALRRIGKIVALSAFTNAVFSGFLYYASRNIDKSTDNLEFAQRIIQPLVKVISADVFRITIVFTLMYAVVAIGFYVLARYLRNHQHNEEVV